MLTLTVQTGDDIVIRIPGRPAIIVRSTMIKSGRVLLSFDAPREVEINRRSVDVSKHPEEYVAS